MEGKQINPTDMGSKAKTEEQKELIKQLGFGVNSMLQLFNIIDDEGETKECSPDYNDIVVLLLNKLLEYKKGVVAPFDQCDDPKADPALHNNTWVPWGSL
ncbi:hypothetical protein WA158_001270 [Blastocystis sp. Blastoise]